MMMISGVIKFRLEHLCCVIDGMICVDVASSTPSIPFESNISQFGDLILCKIVSLAIQEFFVLFSLRIHPLRQRDVLLPLPWHVSMSKPFFVLNEVFKPRFPWGCNSFLTPTNANFLEKTDPFFRQTRLSPLLGIAVLCDLSFQP